MGKPARSTRGGEPIGAYHKVGPVLRTDGSLEHGVMPGREFPLFDALDIALRVLHEGEPQQREVAHQQDTEKDDEADQYEGLPLEFQLHGGQLPR